MREGYGSRSVCECMCVCVCLSVCYRASCYIPGLYVESEAVLSFLYAFKDMCCMDFAENVFFFQEIWRHLPVTMIGDSALSRPKIYQWFLTRLQMA